MICFGIYSFETGFLNYKTFYSEKIIFKIGSAGIFSFLHYYFKGNLDNFKNFESAKKRLESKEAVVRTVQRSR